MENLTAKQDGAERRRQQAHIKNKLLINIVTYLIVMTFLTVVNFITSPGYWWVIWPAMGWGLGLIISIVSRLLSMDQDNYGK
jgi:hypothetical protein